MPMILVKKNPRGKVIRELSSEEETAVKTVGTVANSRW